MARKRKGSTKIKAVSAGAPVPTPANDDQEGKRKPTPERKLHNEFQSMGMANRVVPVIDTLLRSQRITQAEYDALAHYRQQAHKAEDDIAASSSLDPAKIMGGGTSSPTGGSIPAVLMATPAILETARLERELGSLLDIARAVAVDDVTLTQWCIAKHGGRERMGTDGDGKSVVLAIVPKSEKNVMGVALMELRFAAGRIRA